MGAKNVLRAYALYAGKVPPLSMQLLTYMAAVSKDADPLPWFSQGHEALAELALGRDDYETDAAVKAVERAMTPLFKVGAITTERGSGRRQHGAWTARYGLHLQDAQPVDNSVRHIRSVS